MNMPDNTKPDNNTQWQTRFEQECIRLRAALGEITAGGIIENLQHIGATSVPGLPAQSCLDIGLAVWPFPLEAQFHAALTAYGYQAVAGYEAAPEQRFRDTNGAIQLYVVEPGSTRWTDYLLLRDYLRHTGWSLMPVAVRGSFPAPTSILPTPGTCRPPPV